MNPQASVLPPTDSFQCLASSTTSPPILWVLVSLRVSFIPYFHCSGDLEGRGNKHMLNPPWLAEVQIVSYLHISLITSEHALSNICSFKKKIALPFISLTWFVFVLLTPPHPILTVRTFLSIYISVIYIKTLTVGLKVESKIFLWSCFEIKRNFFIAYCRGSMISIIVLAWHSVFYRSVWFFS